jgi:hypothetical protein
VRLLLLFELLQLLRYPIELGLLLGHLLLQLLFLFLPLLHLIANQSAADQTDGSANTSARSGMSGRAADDTAEARSGKCPNSGVLLPSEAVSQFAQSPSTSSGQTDKDLNLRSSNTVRGEALEP